MLLLRHGGSHGPSAQFTGAVLAPHVLLLALQLANGRQQHWLLQQLPCLRSCPCSRRRSGSRGSSQPAVQQLQQLGLRLAQVIAALQSVAKRQRGGACWQLRVCVVPGWHLHQQAAIGAQHLQQLAHRLQQAASKMAEA